VDGVSGWRTAVSAVGAALLSTLLSGLLAAAPAHSTPAWPRLAGAGLQTQCLPSGDAVAPVPWPQPLLAPERAWPLSTGEGQRVAVVSTGVSEPSQLAGAVAASADLAPPPSFGEPSGEPDCLGVGTGVAGIIAAAGADGIGFHGVAPDARILAAKVVGDQFPTDQAMPHSIAPDTLASGIDWAADQDASVIALPTPAYQDSSALQDAVRRAQDAGAVVVASVGEPSAQEPPGIVPYPAAHDGVIGVGAIAADLSAGISRAGHVDLVAPGVDITTTYPAGGLGVTSGTSYAAAFVAGAVALVREYRPGLSPAEVAHRLFATATPAAEAAGSRRYGYGIVNPYLAMVDRVVEGNPAALPPVAPQVVSEEELARQAAQQRSDALASRLAIGGLAIAAVATTAVVFGAKGRRRRWRAGLAAVPPDRPEDDHPEPPTTLFGRRTGTA
jgi:hypothetical protein